jgi:hypothetical protein
MSIRNSKVRKIVLPISDMHSNILFGLKTDKRSAVLPLRDETYRPDVFDYFVVSFDWKYPIGQAS